MSDVVIIAENIGKKYIIGHQARRERYVSLRDVLARSAHNFVRSTRDILHGKETLAGVTFEEYWALKNVDFEIKRGQVWGIIGRNGAGKSTLLKVLSRITEPSEGRVIIRGRVASLLEVGTGFHPELTGRENIYLSGAILGMKHAEIKRKFDEIVNFSGVENFLDTPVKRYSSGMYVRLAFAVAAHLEPEILIVDEVLAVGDIEFQKKCLGKMSEVAGSGRTILFVSHNLGAVASLCKSVLMLSNGRIVQTGPAQKVIEYYTSVSSMNSAITFEPRAGQPSITAVRVDKEAAHRGDFVASIDFVSPFPINNPVGGFVLSSQTNTPVWGTNGRFHPSSVVRGSVTSGTLTCTATSLPLISSTYTLSAWLADWHEDFDDKIDVLSVPFRSDISSPLRPSANVTGNLDWPAAWT